MLLYLRMDLQTWWEKGSKPNQYGRVRQPEVLITLNHFKTGDGIHWKPVSWKPVDIQGGCHRKKLIILFTWVYEQNNLWTAMVTGIRVAWKRKWESLLSINQSYMLYENYYRTVTGKKINITIIKIQTRLTFESSKSILTEMSSSLRLIYLASQKRNLMEDHLQTSNRKEKLER